ncbi:MAG: DUF6449 domain-containing protein [Bacillota bacterium]|nr:DUF6449 domain-containing protein [Bacillota bacterium]
MNSASLFTEILATLKRKLWLPALAAVSLLFAMPVYLGLTLQRFINWSGEITEYYHSGIASALQGVFSTHAASVVAICIIGALVTGLVFTNYLQHRRQVDFYHALPQRRGRLLAVNFGAAFLSGLLPLLLNTLLALLIVLLSGFGSYLDWGAMLGALAVHMLYFTAMLAVVFVAAMLCGNSACAGLLSIVFFGFALGLLGLWSGIGELFYPTWNSQLIDWNALVSHSSPVARYISIAIEDGRYALTALDVLATLLFIAVMYALAWLLYVKRPAEAAGSALAFRVSKQWLKWPIVLLASGGLALLLSVVSGNEGGAWYFIGLFLGAAISAQVMEIIDAYDFRAIKRGLLPLLIFIALFGGASLLMKADVTHYNDYVPEAAEVAAVEIVFDNVNGYANDEISLVYYRRDSSAPLDFYEHSVERHLAQSRLSDADAIAAAVTIAAALVEEQLQQPSELTESPTDEVIRYDQTLGCMVRYTLSNGRQVDRRYSSSELTASRMLEQLAVIYAADDYARSQHELFDYQPQQIRLAEVWSFDNSYDPRLDNELRRADLLQLEPAQLTALLEVYERELCGFSLEQQADSMPVGKLRFYVFAQPPVGALSEDTLDGQHIIYYDYPLYPEFGETIAELAALGVPEQLWLINYEQISYVEVQDYRYQLDYAAQVSADLETLAATSSKYGDQTRVTRYVQEDEIRRLMENSYDYEAFDHNCFAGSVNAVDLLVCYRDDSGGEYMAYRQFIAGFEP